MRCERVSAKFVGVKANCKILSSGLVSIEDSTHHWTTWKWNKAPFNASLASINRGSWSKTRRNQMHSKIGSAVDLFIRTARMEILHNLTQLHKRSLPTFTTQFFAFTREWKNSSNGIRKWKKALAVMVVIKRTAWTRLTDNNCSRSHCFTIKFKEFSSFCPSWPSSAKIYSESEWTSAPVMMDGSSNPNSNADSMWAPL